MKKAETEVLIFAIVFIVTIVAVVYTIYHSTWAIEKQTIDVSEDVKQKTGKFVSVIEVYGYSEDMSYIDRYFLKVKLSPGAPGIEMDKLIIRFSCLNETFEMLYNGSNNCANLDNFSFTYRYLMPGDFFHDGYLSKEDIVEICFGIPMAVGVKKKASILFLPLQGEKTEIEFKTPPIFEYKNVMLYP